MSRAKINPSAPFQSISGAAALTGLSGKYIRKMISDGRCPYVMVGADYRVNMPLLLEALDAESRENLVK